MAISCEKNLKSEKLGRSDESIYILLVGVEILANQSMITLITNNNIGPIIDYLY